MRTTLASLLALTLAACGSPRPTSDPAPAARIAIDDIPVQAPPGDGWRMVERSDESVVFEREIPESGAVLTAIAGLFPSEFANLEECRASLHRDSYVETATHRNPIGNVRIVDDVTPPYVRVRYGADEADQPGPGANWSTLTSEFRWFLRPRDGRGVMLSFSERRPRGSKPTEYGGQATLFFDSLRFAEQAPLPR